MYCIERFFLCLVLRLCPGLRNFLPGRLLFFRPVFAFRPFLFWISGFRDLLSYFPENFRFCSIRLHRCFTAVRAPQRIRWMLVSGILRLTSRGISGSAPSGCTAALRSPDSAVHPAGCWYPGSCALLSQEFQVLLHQAARLLHALRTPQHIRWILVSGILRLTIPGISGSAQ